MTLARSSGAVLGAVAAVAVTGWRDALAGSPGWLLLAVGLAMAALVLGIGDEVDRLLSARAVADLSPPAVAVPVPESAPVSPTDPVSPPANTELVPNRNGDRAQPAPPTPHEQQPRAAAFDRSRQLLAELNAIVDPNRFSFSPQCPTCGDFNLKDTATGGLVCQRFNHAVPASVGSGRFAVRLRHREISYPLQTPPSTNLRRDT